MLLVYKQEGFAPLNLYVEEEFDRASCGGTGGIKSITNYGPVWGICAVMKPCVN